MDKRILLLGLGKTGLAIAKFLHQRNIAFMAYDTRANPANLHLFQELFPNLDIYLEAYPADIFTNISKIISSPGVLPTTPFLLDAKAHGIAIESDLDLLADEIDAPVLAITGSNGKSTVTTLLGEILRAEGLKVAVGGNLGTPVLDLLDMAPRYDAWVLELSSFQLNIMHRLRFKAATILNISPDHIDYHGSMQAYIEAKQRIYQFADFAVYNRQDAASVTDLIPSSSFGLDEPKYANWGIRSIEGRHYISYAEDIYLAVDALKIKGQHNWQNAMAAAALALAFGVKKQTIISALQSFPGLKHRTQWVKTHQGVDFINDSKATNLGASLAAIEGIGPNIQGKILLIAGGQAKGADFKSMRASLSRYVKKAYLIGQDASILAADWQGSVAWSYCHDLAAAVQLAFSEANSGDVILLAPACASLDMFQDYQDRGDQFVRIVEEMIE